MVLWMAAYSTELSHADGVSRATRYLTSGAFLAIRILFTYGSWSIC